MASIIARRAFTTSARRLTSSQEALKAESKKNPEIMVRQIPTAITTAPARGSATSTPEQSGLAEMRTIVGAVLSRRSWG